MAGTSESSYSEQSENLAKPLHLQRLEQAMKLDTFLNQVENVFAANLSESDDTTDTENEGFLSYDMEQSGWKLVNGIMSTKQERRSDKARLYNFSRVKKGRKWLKNILLSDSSDNEDGEDEEVITEEDLQTMLKLHLLKKRHYAEFHADREMKQYQYYGVGLLSNHDHYPDHHKLFMGNKKKVKEKKGDKKMKAKLKRMRKKEKRLHDLGLQGQLDDGQFFHPLMIKTEDGRFGHERRSGGASKKKSAVVTEASLIAKRRRLWVALSKKEIPRAQKQKVAYHKEVLTNCKKMAQACQKEIRKTAIQFQKSLKETPSRARRLTREMLLYWKRYDRVEKELRKRAEKEAQEQMKMDIELREAKRQQRKLNFLITQTELYAHFMSRKLGTAGANPLSVQEKILRQLEDDTEHSFIDDDYDSDVMKTRALNHAHNAYEVHQIKHSIFDGDVSLQRMRVDDFRLTDPSLSTEQDRPQPGIFKGKLKVYQLKGMNWLANLYDQGINGILADEMGLGKTVQSIAFLAHIAESQDIWGPFLVIAPASTLHNWQQEFSRFLPKLKVLPYWGNTSDRKILRKFWNKKDLHTEDASFHVLVTSYQLVVQDVKYFQRIKWQYMVLDEAQAIKSSSSVRWKILLGFNCRNRLLLTGTPIQNSMAELWALLHFIMPTLFDSHDEFNEWFSKDIESHAENKSTIDEKHLSRLHMILKPFMLRRIKKDVENELSDKIEIMLYCHLTTRQKKLYQGLKSKISIDDLLHSAVATEATSQSQSATSSLMNLVMQFRKVCNHPELFERREVRSPFVHRPDPLLVPKHIYCDGILRISLPSKQHLHHGLFNIFHPDNVHRSQCGSESGPDKELRCFSFLRFIDLSPAELSRVMLHGLLVRWLLLCSERSSASNRIHRIVWRSPDPSGSDDVAPFLISPVSTLSLAGIESNVRLRRLVFTGHSSPVYSHTSHYIHAMPETVEHRKIRARRLIKTVQPAAVSVAAASGGVAVSKPVASIAEPPVTVTAVPMATSLAHPGLSLAVSGSAAVGPTVIPQPGSSAPKHSSAKTGITFKKSTSTSVVRVDESLLPEFIHRELPVQTFHCQPTDMPKFLTLVSPKLTAHPLEFYCSDRSAAWWRLSCTTGIGLEGLDTWTFGSPDLAEEHASRKAWFHPPAPGGLVGTMPSQGWSNVIIPDKETLVTDSGKLYVLDELLRKLKVQGHRVLIYSQMTRMIDLLEEYMWHRKHTYMRLDGSSKISERRDMVADFQSRSDIFVFLLSTRAGGLGINLTAADTVVFYDSDWNPTVDQQAMDRAHRLGQTKQVTVYRLICKGSIEERILQRAREKSEIQRMVISGGNFKPDTLKPKEVVSLLLDDDELETKFRQRQAERRILEEQLLDRGDKRRKREKQGKAEKKVRGGKRPKLEENITIPASQDTESIISIDSIPPSPNPSEKSFGSNAALHQDDTSNEGSLVVDDGSPLIVASSTSVSSMLGQQSGSSKKSGKSNRGTGRSRGRPKGSGKRGNVRGRGGSMAAAEMAGAQAGATAAYAAYGYSVTPSVTPNLPGGSGSSIHARPSHVMVRHPTVSSGGGAPVIGGNTGGGIRMRGAISQSHRFSPGGARGTPSSHQSPEGTSNVIASSPQGDGHASGSTGMGFYVQNSGSPFSP